MDLQEMGITAETYKKWPALRRMFALQATIRTGYVEDHYLPEIAAPVIEKITEFVKSSDELTAESIQAFGNSIENQDVRIAVKTHLNFSLLHAQRTVGPA